VKGPRPDIKSVMREERSRGRQPIDTDQEALRKNFQRDFELLLYEGDRKKFKTFLIAHGQQEGGEQFRHSMSLWDTYQKTQQKNRR
jgi:hypothetical protein